jgi:hypothetical protein
VRLLRVAGPLTAPPHHLLPRHCHPRSNWPRNSDARPGSRRGGSCHPPARSRTPTYPSRIKTLRRPQRAMGTARAAGGYPVMARGGVWKAVRMDIIFGPQSAEGDNATGSSQEVLSPEYSRVDCLRWPGRLGSQPPHGRWRRPHLRHHRGHRGSTVGRIPHEPVWALRRDRVELAEFRSGRPGSGSATAHPAIGPRRRIPRARPLSFRDLGAAMARQSLSVGAESLTATPRRRLGGQAMLKVGEDSLETMD